MTVADISIWLYNLALIPVVAFSVLFIILVGTNLLVDRKSPARKTDPTFTPRVTIQIPSFNDPVAERCVLACLELDYPKDLFDIMIVDDSTDVSTQKRLKGLAKKHDRVSYVHRVNREGYKPGALRDAMHLVQGEFIVIFDADFVPKKEFLREIVQPFKDEKVAIVQGRQAFLNKDVNLVSRFAAYLLMVHHYIYMPINDHVNAVFFCGTAGALRKSAIEEVGGWNAASVTEDSDLSVKILAKGYRALYIPIDTPSEVPVTLENFIKQQMRWSFGNVRVFFDHTKDILFSRKFSFGQRAMISFFTLGNFLAPAVILMTIFGFMGWFFGAPELFGWQDIGIFAFKIIITAGFLVLALVMLLKAKRVREFPTLLLAAVSVSLILAVVNTYAIYRAVFHPQKPLFSSQKNSWICTPKSGNEEFHA